MQRRTPCLPLSGLLWYLEPAQRTYGQVGGVAQTGLTCAAWISLAADIPNDQGFRRSLHYIIHFKKKER